MHLISSILLLVLLFPVNIFGQDGYEMSEPLDISEAGWNKVLQMKNGNTLIFHFENRRAILVKVFDKSRKEIASVRNLTTIVDLNKLDATENYGIYRIGNEVVFFLAQYPLEKETLFRLRFDSLGKLIREEKMSELNSSKKYEDIRILANERLEQYNVITCSREANDSIGNLKLLRYNARHEVVKELNVELAYKLCRTFYIVGASIDNMGSILTSIYAPGGPYLALYYLPYDNDNFISKIIEVPDALHDYSTYFVYNSFDKRLNILLKDVFKGSIKKGTADERKLSIYEYTLISAPDDLNGIESNSINRDRLNKHLQSLTDTSRLLYDKIFGMHINNYGVTTLLSTEYRIYTRRIKSDKWLTEYIAVRKFNDNGEEIWTTILPKSNLRPIEGNYPIIMRTESAEMDLLSTQSYSSRNNTYILFNELDKNFNLEFNKHTDSMLREEAMKYSYNITNAVYYTINRKKEITQQYIFGKPEPDDYKHVYVTSGDYDEDNNMLAVLALRNKNNKNTIHLAWKQL